jgi:hypothetical protein
MLFRRLRLSVEFTSTLSLWASNVPAFLRPVGVKDSPRIDAQFTKLLPLSPRLLLTRQESNLQTDKC